jgi:outer membrane lipoprotein-sorting protein
MTDTSELRCPLIAAVLVALGGMLLCWGRLWAETAAEPANPSEGKAAAASPEPVQPALPPELRMVLDQMDGAGEKLADFTAKVSYERAIPLLDEKEKSKGNLTFKKPNRIALQLGPPRNEDVYTNGKQWWLVNHDDRQVEVYQAAEDKATAETAFLDFGYGRGSQKLLQDYDVQLIGQQVQGEGKDRQTLYRLRFVPRPKPDRPARYAAIEIEVSDRLWLPQTIVLHEGGGEVIHTYALSSIRVNTAVKDSVFDYKVPGGYAELRPQEF